MKYLVAEFTADDSGYHTDVEIMTERSAERACREWCENQKIKFSSLDDYEKTDKNGFFYSFSVAVARLGAEISTGQWR